MNSAPHIIPCLLDIQNTTAIGVTTVSGLIQGQGRKHLWDDRPSPLVDTIVIHYVSACDVDRDRPFDLGQILQIFCTLTVSSHYLIQRDGRTYRLVPDDKRAWHCGGSIMPVPDGRTRVNDFSIGIEFVATHDSGFTPEQYESCARLCKYIDKQFGRACVRIGHQDIAGQQAVDRGLRKDIKLDPGPLFNWQLLAKQMI
jgi:N-acetyl-anhydromuramyl-L-alanine amidase AmpD